MVTGDNLITAKAISRECGILNEELANAPDSVMEGP
jgi:Ca2+-transporting ATPase